MVGIFASRDYEQAAPEMQSDHDWISWSGAAARVAEFA
jgi:hypothetical protein